MISPQLYNTSSLHQSSPSLPLIKMGRPPCCDKSNVKRGPWTPEEDAKILAYVATHGTGNWTLVPQKAGLNRCGKSCRLRWTNYLRPDLKHDNFTPEEEECILRMHKTIGSRWSLIAKQLPGRTDNDVKNYWNTKLKKKLSKMGIDPITHKPFSQLFTEYGTISGSHITRNRNPFFSSPNNDSIHKITHKFRPENATQFQVMDQENVDTHLPDEAASGVMRFACGPSGACFHPQAQMVPASSSPFSCNEYILGGPSFSSMDETPECKNVDMSAGIVGQCSSSGLTAADTFVEDMLAHDSEMRLQFPDIFCENYDY